MLEILLIILIGLEIVAVTVSIINGISSYKINSINTEINREAVEHAKTNNSINEKNIKILEDYRNQVENFNQVTNEAILALNSARVDLKQIERINKRLDKLEKVKEQQE